MKSEMQSVGIFIFQHWVLGQCENINAQRFLQRALGPCWARPLLHRRALRPGARSSVRLLCAWGARDLQRWQLDRRKKNATSRLVDPMSNATNRLVDLT